MSRYVLAAAAALLTPGIWASSYPIAAPNYTAITNYTTCTLGSCANFTTAMGLSGTFTTTGPLAANLATQNISSQVTSYSFSDGLDTFSSTDPNARIFLFTVSTDAAGTITAIDILLELWEGGASPHSAGDRFDFFQVSIGGATDNRAYHNIDCASVAAALSGAADSCVAAPLDQSASQASGPAATLTAPVAVPTLSEWGLLTLAGILGTVGWQSLRRRAA